MMFKKASFRYPQRSLSRIVTNLSMRVPPGQFIALVGASGSGKSTTVALIERFYDTSSGNISIGSTDMKILSPELYRQRIAIVQQ